MAGSLTPASVSTASATGFVVDADRVSVTPTGQISSTDVQAALAELDSEKAPTGNLALTVSSTDVVLTEEQFANNSFDITGALTASINIIVPDGIAHNLIVDNATSGAFTVTVKHSATAGVVVPQGTKVLLYTNGTTIEGVDAIGGGGSVTSVFGRTGDVVATSGDYTAAQVGLGNVRNVDQIERTSATGSAVLPSGTTAQRDGSPTNGHLRYNSDTSSIEGYIGGAWGSVGGAGYTWINKSAAYTMSNLDAVFADSSGGAFTLTLPATPSLDDKVFIFDGVVGGSWGDNTVTVGRNGSTIEGAASDWALATFTGWAEFIYDGTTWRVRQNFTDSVIDFTGRSTDAPLLVGQKAKVAYTAATSVPLHVATGSGELYRITMVNQADAGSSGTAYLNPNNTTYASAFIRDRIYQTGTTVGGSRDSLNAVLLGYCNIRGNEALISTETLRKWAKAESHGLSTNWYNERFFLDWNDTTTAWTSLGTLVFSNSTTGEVLIERLK